MQNANDLELFYEKEDPWGYKTNESDLKRKNKIIGCLSRVYDKAIDIGCGEGFITQDLPAKQIFGYDVAKNAASRCKDNINVVDEISGKYDLVLMTGVLYPQYDYEWILDVARKVATHTIVTCNIDAWQVEIPEDIGRLVYMETFRYRNYIQRLSKFEVTS